jgi:hypothetical protein
MSLLFSLGLRSTKNNGSGILVCFLFDVENIYYCVSKFFDFRLDFASVCGVVHSPKYGSKTSIFLRVVRMKVGVFLY